MIARCGVCKKENVEVFEIETVHGDQINCCNECWDSEGKWDLRKESVSIAEKKPMRLNTKVSHDLNVWLDKRSEELGVSKSALVAIAVESYRKEVETISYLPKLLAKLEEMGVNINE